MTIEGSGPPPGQPPIFVVTSGRSGSTLLARLLHSHPDITVISDLFEPVGVMPYLDADRIVTGAAFWGELCAPSHPERIRHWRCQPTDELLYLPERDEHVSLLLCYTLPFLSGGDPRALADEVREVVHDFDPAPITEQLLRLFVWLRDRHGGVRWVERTGGSLPHTPALVDVFGDRARFVHLHRDPREVAVSMQTGSFFRLYLALSEDPDLDAGDWAGRGDVVDFCRLVTRWEVAADAALARVEPRRVHRLTYEDLTAEPRSTLADLVAFILERETSLDDRRWADQQAAEVGPAPRRSDRLPLHLQRALDVACRPALEVLGRG